MFGKKKKRLVKDLPVQEKILPDGSKYEETRIRLDRPAPSAVWGTTTLVGRQKK